jgi:hypothetical protein
MISIEDTYKEMGALSKSKEGSEEKKVEVNNNKSMTIIEEEDLEESEIQLHNYNKNSLTGFRRQTSL